MTPLAERSKCRCYTPLYKNEQKQEQKKSMETTEEASRLKPSFFLSLAKLKTTHFAGFEREENIGS